MAALDPVVGNALNDAILNNTSGASSIVIGALTLTTPYAIRFDGTRGTAGAAGTVISGTSSTTLAGLVATASASSSNVPTKSNTSAASITTTASGTWNGIEIFDANATPKRILFGPTADLGKAFASGDILSIPTGQLTLTTT